MRFSAGDRTVSESSATEPATAASSRPEWPNRARSPQSARACALTANGEAYCWGSDDFGEIGNLHRSTAVTDPTRAGGPRSLYAQLTVGPNRSCGLTREGRAYCWGNNDNGVLGNGNNSMRTVPTEVVGGLQFMTISIGFNHTCGLTRAGEAYCWGTNTYGQLGDGTSMARMVPTRVIGERTFRSISAGGLRTCAVTADGEAYCWGQRFGTQLGDAPADAATTTPALVAGVTFRVQTG